MSVYWNGSRKRLHFHLLVDVDNNGSGLGMNLNYLQLPTAPITLMLHKHGGIYGWI